MKIYFQVCSLFNYNEKDLDNKILICQNRTNQSQISMNFFNVQKIRQILTTISSENRHTSRDDDKNNLHLLYWCLQLQIIEISLRTILQSRRRLFAIGLQLDTFKYSFTNSYDLCFKQTKEQRLSAWSCIEYV